MRNISEWKVDESKHLRSVQPQPEKQTECQNPNRKHRQHQITQKADIKIKAQKCTECKGTDSFSNTDD